jgi:hypothetical protein
LIAKDALRDVTGGKRDIRDTGNRVQSVINVNGDGKRARVVKHIIGETDQAQTVGTKVQAADTS